VTDPFATPSSGNSGSGEKTPTLTGFEGALVLVFPKEHCAPRKTIYSRDDNDLKDSVRIDFAVLDGPSAGELIEDALVFQGRLIGMLKRHVPKGVVLGRVGKAPSPKGQQAWTLLDPTAADAEIGREWLRENGMLDG
jgi:hypothetical protein